ncbi:hypothetical protein [Aetokthonos hydrillicola]|jgi:uncharacterized SAM-dependent methyltransferase|uniref:hypothetical protein n=1 Tax=Aetokthonos hydrillicola TaxID=1550245 RepID=UPI001B1DAD1E|nr:hypothetical protein [Aetokthonos hydrillicola]MBO3462996.1 hypothetical protein [Aetokthonos hydrillicola CCALA 1050]MBW4587201.1 L-histidine N(alpha)-methyltransferase [Aetokthonos hydrillicola CCALA 1050]
MLKTSFKFLTEDYQALNNDGEDVIQGLTLIPKILHPKYFYKVWTDQNQWFGLILCQA